MISRKENGKLVVHSLDMEIFFGELFEKCQSQHEIEWVRDELTGIIDLVSDEQLEKFE